MPSLLASIHKECTATGGRLVLTQADATPGFDPDAITYSWEILDTAGHNYGGAFVLGNLPERSVVLPNGDYLAQVLAVAGAATYFSREFVFTIACSPSGGSTSPAPLVLASLTSTSVTAAGHDGTATGTATGGTAPLTALLVETGATKPVTAGQTFTFTGLDVGTYTVRVSDAAGKQVQDTITIRAAAVGGCTDPLATNRTPGATFEDGSCLYAPPVLPLFFAVPLLQSLRFSVRALPGPDGQPFCEQPRPGQQVRPYFYQLVQPDDPLTVQVLSSYLSVSVSVFHHGGGLAAGPKALTKVRTLEGPAAPLAVTLRQSADGLTKLTAAGGGSLPASLLGAARLSLAGGASGTYRISQAVPGSVVALDDYLLLNRPWAAPTGPVSATWLLTGPGYNVFETAVPIGALAAGYYTVRLRASQAGAPDEVAESEPLHLKAQHANTVAVDYRNADNCFGLVFTTGLTPRLRVPASFFRQKNGGTETTYTDSAGRLTTLASTATRLLTLETYGLPAWLHEKLFLACRLDYLLVDGVRCQAPGPYEVTESRAYPLTSGRVELQQSDWLGAGNGDDSGVDETAPENALALRRGGYLLLRKG